PGAANPRLQRGISRPARFSRPMIAALWLRTIRTTRAQQTTPSRSCTSSPPSGYALEPSGNTVVTFEERPSGSPEALHAWFYPGDTDGFEFVYPKSEQQYAAQSEQPAPAAAVPAAPQQVTTEQAAAEQPESESPTPVVVGEEEQ